MNDAPSVARSSDDGGDPAPIALFVYNRLPHARRTVEALRANRLATASDLFVFSDAPQSAAQAEDVAAVRDYVRTIDGFRSVEVVERERNRGVDASVVDGVTRLCDRHGRAIVLEDDCVTSPHFLEFMNAGLQRYAADARVMHVSGFMFPVAAGDTDRAAFVRFVSSWGWATWQRAWKQFDATASGYAAIANDSATRRSFDLDGAYDYFSPLERVANGQSTAWDIRWYATVFLNDGLSLAPFRSLVENIGFDGSGVHCPPSSFPGRGVGDRAISVFPDVLRCDSSLARAMESYLFEQQPDGIRKSLRRAARMLHRRGGDEVRR